MNKKIGLFFFSFIAVLGVGTSFADIIPDNAHYLSRCAKFKNDGIDGYKPIYVQSGVERRDCGCSPFYGSYNCCRDDLGLPGEPYRHAHYVNIGKCLPSEDLTIYLLSESVDLEGITQHNINEKAIFIGDLSVKPSGYVDNSNPFTSETLIYKIVKNGNNYELEMSESSEKNNFVDNNVIEELHDCGYRNHWVSICIIIQNKEIDNYKVIIGRESIRGIEDIYEPQKCLKGGYNKKEGVYLLDKSEDIDEITKENIQDKAIKLGTFYIYGYCLGNSDAHTGETHIYKLVKDGNNYKLKKSDIVEFKMPEGGEEGDFADNIIIEESGNYLLEPDDEEQDIENTEIDEDIGNENNYKLELVESEQGIDVTSGKRITKFAIARILTILIETIILFAIAKLFRKNDQISNWKLLLFGILASTITLPLLRFVLPLFIMDGTWYTVIGELLVTLIEVFIIKYGLKISRGKAILASIVCNLCSYLLGLIVF